MKLSSLTMIPLIGFIFVFISVPEIVFTFAFVFVFVQPDGAPPALEPDQSAISWMSKRLNI